MQKTTRKRKRKRKEKVKKQKGHSEIIKDAKISLEKYIYIFSTPKENASQQQTLATVSVQRCSHCGACRTAGGGRRWGPPSRGPGAPGGRGGRGPGGGRWGLRRPRCRERVGVRDPGWGGEGARLTHKYTDSTERKGKKLKPTESENSSKQ